MYNQHLSLNWLVNKRIKCLMTDFGVIRIHSWQPIYTFLFVATGLHWYSRLNFSLPTNQDIRRPVWKGEVKVSDLLILHPGLMTISQVMSPNFCINVNICPLSCFLPREMNIYVNVCSKCFFLFTKSYSAPVQTSIKSINRGLFCQGTLVHVDSLSCCDQ